MRPQRFHVFKGFMFYSELKNKQRRAKACWSFLRFACPGFHHPCRNSAHSMLQLKPLGQELLLQSNWVKHFYSISQANLCSLWGAKLLVLPVGMVLRLASLFSEVHPFLVGCWEFPESITMTAFSMEPDSGESKSAPGESLDEEVATFCFQGT